LRLHLMALAKSSFYSRSNAVTAIRRCETDATLSGKPFLHRRRFYTGYQRLNLDGCRFVSTEEDDGDVKLAGDPDDEANLADLGLNLLRSMFLRPM
jgi:hypothetical protein